MRIGSVLGVLALTTTLALARDPSTSPALGDAPDGGERSAGTNAERAQDRFESETRSKSDEMLADAVHKRLSDDARTNAMRIKVDAREGVVRLTGEVVDTEERDTAATVAQHVPGVRDVQNRLEVTRAGAPAPGTSVIPERTHP
jgi:osmotically-inducible protein OsmY